MSSDDEAPVVKKKLVPRKKADDSSDDDAPVVKKPLMKKAAAKRDDDSSSDDDAAPVVRKPIGKRAAKKAADSSDSDSDGAAVVKKPAVRRHVDPTADSSDSDDDVPRKGAGAAASSGPLVDLIAYDAMSVADFHALLKRQSKRARLAEKQQLADRKKAQEAEEDGHGVEKHFDGSQAYSYQTMLDRIMTVVRRNNPELSTEERIRLPMPKIERYGSKKTALSNFKEMCLALGRTQEEVKDYVEKSLTTTSALDSNHVLILKYQNAKTSTFEKLIEKYVEEYVKCHSCRRIQTDLTKESASRLTKLSCRHCKATRYIQAAGTATFKAQTSKRSRQRAAAALV